MIPLAAVLAALAAWPIMRLPRRGEFHEPRHFQRHDVDRGGGLRLVAQNSLGRHRRAEGKPHQANATIASKMINFEPKPGLMIFSNAWLAHSFTRHASEKPIKFVHFNLTVQQNAPINHCKPIPPAEVI